MLSLFKHIFGSAAYGADPTFREFIKGCVRGDISIRIALFRIVNITADITFPFLHLESLRPNSNPPLPLPEAAKKLLQVERAPIFSPFPSPFEGEGKRGAFCAYFNTSSS